MAVSKLSQIALSPANVISSDTLVGVHGGNTDYQFSPSQVGAGIPIIIAVTPTSSGTDTCLLFDKAGVIGEDTNLEWNYSTHVLHVGETVAGEVITTYFQSIGSSGAGAGVYVKLSTDTTQNRIILGLDGSDNPYLGMGPGGSSVLGFALYPVFNATSNCWFFGNAGSHSTTGWGNIAIGQSAQSTATTGNLNIAFGHGAMLNGSGGDHNLAIGLLAGQSLTTGGENAFIGTQCGQFCQDGSNNFAMGPDTLVNNVHGHDNVAIGFNCIVGGEASNCVALGNQALRNVSGGVANTCIGGVSTVTPGATITTGSQNIVIGAGCDVPSASANGQLSLGNFIYGTGLTSVGSNISSGAIGLGIKGPTASLHIEASTTAQANIRLDPTSAAGPTSPNDGDLWYDGTNLKFRQGATTHIIV